MIYEYALDPEYLSKLCNDASARVRIVDAFKPGTPYVRADYPQGLPTLVKEIFNEQKEKVNTDQEMNRINKNEAKVMAMLNSLRYETAKRFNTQKWDKDFSKENERFSFDVILTDKTGIPGNIKVIKEDNNPFTLEHGKSVLRLPKEMNECLSPLLKNASDITFVDPYFYPALDSYKEPYKLFFSTISESDHVRLKKKPRIINIVCSPKTFRDSTEEEFEASCKEEIPNWLKADTKVNIYLIYKKDEGQEIHNRYILTDIGGVMLGHGTDRSRNLKNDSYDDINILSSTQLDFNKKLYMPKSEYFDWKKQIEI